MKYYAKTDNDGNQETFYGVYLERSSVEIISITKYSTGFCEVKKYGRRNFRRQNRKEISGAKFKLEFTKAMQYLQLEVLREIKKENV